jgi:hypothetical protein
MQGRWLTYALILILCGCALDARSLDRSAPIENLLPTTRSSAPAQTLSAPTPISTVPRATVVPPSSDSSGASPTIPRTPARAQSSDQKTFASTELGISFEYPTTWQVQAAGNQIIVTSSRGTPIYLTRSETKPAQGWLEPQEIPNTRCTLKTNSHGTRINLCFDTLAFSHSANLTLVVNGTEQFWTISLRTRQSDERAILDALLETVRPPI